MTTQRSKLHSAAVWTGLTSKAEGRAGQCRQPSTKVTATIHAAPSLFTEGVSMYLLLFYNICKADFSVVVSTYAFKVTFSPALFSCILFPPEEHVFQA